MANYELVLFALLVRFCRASYVPFDDATASSVNSATYAGGPEFAATNANTFGDSYWCSGGGHLANQVVVWSGMFSVSRPVSGVKLNWAHSPGDIKVLVSPNGADFSEVASWHSPSRADESFAEHVMFESPTSIQALSVLMRKPRAWGYFGLKSVSVIAEDGPAMLISGMNGVDETCIVSSPLHGNVSVTTCVDAIAAGDGREVFEVTSNGQVRSAVRPDLCLSLLGGDTTDGGHVGTESCRQVAESNDGRGEFEFTSAGQIRLPRMGNFCLTSESGDGGSPLLAKDCTEAASSVSAADKFFLQAVREESLASARAAKSSASLAQKSAARLTGLLAELARAAEACGLSKKAANRTVGEQIVGETLELERVVDSWDSTRASMVQHLGVDREALVAVVNRAKDLLAKLHM